MKLPLNTGKHKSQVCKVSHNFNLPSVVQWTGFYMIGTFVMKELKAFGRLIGRLQENHLINSLLSVVLHLNRVMWCPDENGQTHDKNLATFAARILTCV